MIEAWRSVPGYVGAYEVSDAGNVRSLDRKDSAGQRVLGRMLKPRLHSNGYLRVNLSKQGKASDIFVHRLVLEVFIGPCPSGQEGCHNDGNRANNAISNLRWDTRIGNSADRKRHGSQPMGSKHWAVRCPEWVNRGDTHPTAILNSTDVERIRDLRANGCTQAAVAAWIGKISRESISRIDRGLSWKRSAG